MVYCIWIQRVWAGAEFIDHQWRFLEHSLRDLRTGGRPPKPLLQGKVDRIGTAEANLSVDHGAERAATRIKAEISSFAVDFLVAWTGWSRSLCSDSIGAVGHRVVHGMHHTDPETVTPQLLDELKRIIPFDPEHLPREIELIEALRHRKSPQLPRVACFDTAFHRSMPLVATQLPIPRRATRRGNSALRLSRPVVYVSAAGAGAHR